MTDFDEIDTYALSHNKQVKMPVVCPICKILLTTLELNDRCTINVNVKCNTCGEVCTGRNLWAELVGRI